MTTGVTPPSDFGIIKNLKQKHLPENRSKFKMDR